MQEHVVLPADAGLRLDLWLVRCGGAASRGQASGWIDRGKVFVNDREAGAASRAYRVVAGDRIGVWLDRPGSSRGADRGVAEARDSLAVVHEDASIVVVDKPAGQIVEPLPDEAGSEATVLDLLADRYRHQPRARVYVVHRIDRDTTGLVLFARTAAARDALKAQFERRTPGRLYQAIVVGDMAGAEDRWRDLLAWDREARRQRRAHGTDAGAKPAEAAVRVLERFAGATLIEVSLVTGKRNQIRVQAAMRGYPLLGERQYRFGAPPEAETLPRIGRQALHAWRLSFTHPETSRSVSFTSPLPADFERARRALRNATRR